MTYTLYGGDILPREPRVPRCEAMRLYSSKPSPRVAAMDSAAPPYPPRSARSWVSVPQEVVSPPTQRVVPSSRTEAAALLDELQDRLAAQPRMSYANQMKLVDFGLAEAARQTRSHCVERGDVLELLRGEYARLLTVMQGPSRSGRMDLAERLHREQARTTELTRQLRELQEREDAMKGQWTKRRATVQLAMAGLRLTTLSSASGANPTGLEASAEQTAAVEQVEALPPQGKLAVITHAARKLTSVHKAAAAAAVLQALRQHPEELCEVLGGALGALPKEERAEALGAMRRE